MEVTNPDEPVEFNEDDMVVEDDDLDTDIYVDDDGPVVEDD